MVCALTWAQLVMVWGSRFALHRKVMVRTCSSVRWWWENHDPWRMDFFFLHAFFGHLHLMMHTTSSHRLAKSLYSPVSIHLSLGCGLPPHVPTTTLTVARHPPCQEPHILIPLDGGILIEEDLPDEAVIAPRRQAPCQRDRRWDLLLLLLLLPSLLHKELDLQDII